MAHFPNPGMGQKNQSYAFAWWKKKNLTTTLISRVRYGDGDVTGTGCWLPDERFPEESKAKAENWANSSERIWQHGDQVGAGHRPRQVSWDCQETAAQQGLPVRWCAPPRNVAVAAALHTRMPSTLVLPPAPPTARSPSGRTASASCVTASAEGGSGRAEPLAQGEKVIPRQTLEKDLE